MDNNNMDQFNEDQDDIVTVTDDTGKDRNDPSKDRKNSKFAKGLFDFIEMLSIVTVAIVMCFSFIFRLNIVQGPSMEDTLYTGQFLIVSDLGYTPKTGDIVVIHDMTAGNYSDPIVKRVIATGGQTVDIDFSTWTLTVDGEVLNETYAKFTDDRTLTADYDFPITVEEGNIFVLGDNRNHSADSRLSVIGQIDERCVVGKVYLRIFPFKEFKLFTNPYDA